MSFSKFAVAYRAGLQAAVEANPTEYFLDGRSPEQFAEIVSARILASMKSNPMGVNYNGGGFTRACRAVGIKPTRKAILEFISRPEVTP